MELNLPCFPEIIFHPELVYILNWIMILCEIESCYNSRRHSSHSPTTPSMPPLLCNLHTYDGCEGHLSTSFAVKCKNGSQPSARCCCRGYVLHYYYYWLPIRIITSWTTIICFIIIIIVRPTLPNLTSVSGIGLVSMGDEAGLTGDWLKCEWKSERRGFNLWIW